MKATEVAFQSLLGKVVRDRHGKALGRIEEVRARREGNHLVIEEYILGRKGLLERLAATGIRLKAIPFVQPENHFKPQTVRWDELDISNPERPKFIG